MSRRPVKSDAEIAMSILYQPDDGLAVKPLKAGIKRHPDGNGDSSSSTLWAVYDREAAETEVGWIADDGNTEFAERLTGLHHTSCQPGGYFTHEPSLKVYGKKLLVTQFRGMDI